MDTEELNHLKQLRAKYVRNLRRLELAEADYDSNVPLNIVNGIERFRNLIAETDQKIAYLENAKTNQAHVDNQEFVSDVYDLSVLLIKYCDEKNIRSICSVLDIDFDKLPNVSLGGKIWELADFADKGDTLAVLVDALKQVRPDILATYITPEGKTSAKKDAPSSQHPNSAASLLKYKQGQKVRHSKYGEGTVISSKKSDNDEEVTIHFKKGGVKRMLSSFASLQAIPNSPAEDTSR